MAASLSSPAADAAPDSPLAALLRQRLEAPGDPVGAKAAALERHGRERLAVLRAAADLDPFGNPLLLGALEISRMIDRGETEIGVLRELVQRLGVRSFADRADRLSRYLGETDPAANEQAIAALIRDLAGTPAISFDSFRNLVERPAFGIVLTAHPTFGMPIELSRLLMRLATGREADGQPLTSAATAATLRDAAGASLLPPAALTLEIEHLWSMAALGHIQDAMDRLAGIVLGVAAELYPDDWTQLIPRLITAASWVGYDLDGRSDIAWTDTIAKRLLVKQAQLLRHQCAIAGLTARGADLGPVPGRIDAAIDAVGQQLAAIDLVAREPASLSDLAGRFVALRHIALVETKNLTEALGASIAAAASPELKRDLAVLRASFAGHGLGLAHTHVRLNATQLHNAIRKEIGMETAPNDPSHRRSYMNGINDLLGRVKPATVNFATLMAERATAKRLFMIVQQMLKYIDGETPVRFLIAETEAGLTLLTALYFARLFGVDERVEISPLFETEEALEHGDSILEEALRSPHYRAYVRKLGRVCVQFGFSDSGRYLGQMAASFQIERLRVRLAAVLTRHKLGDVQLVLFNTHGESIGRGGHPISLGDRLRYAAPPFTRGVFAERGLASKEEVSFQGGDGFQMFMGLPAALAVVRGVCETFLRPDPEAKGDPIYAAGDFSVEFFATIKQHFTSLVDDPTYATLLGAFGANLSPRGGSRPVKRQHEGALRAMDLAHVSQLRAIPNNAILQQLGLFANTIYGVGHARVKDPELFDDLRQRSPRFRRAMAMVEAALGYSDLDVLNAYTDTLDPGMWLTRSGRTRSSARAKELRLVSANVDRLDLNPPLVKIVRRLEADYLLLTDRPGAYGGGLTGAIEPSRRDTVLMLHVLRFAVIHRIYLLAVHVPEFSPHHGLSREDIVARLMRLDVPSAVASLKEIFPKVDPDPVAVGGGIEPATYRGDVGQSYAREHDTLFDPMLRLYDLVIRIGAALSHEFGAVG